MLIFFSGLAISLVYDIGGFFLVKSLDGETAAVEFFAAYTSSFRTIISLGLILGAAMLVFFVQSDIAAMVESAFWKDQLFTETKYFKYRIHFWRLRKTLIFGAQLGFAAFLIFSFCHFKLSRTGDILMMIAVCAEYVLASFVGRKLMYTAMMIHSLADIKVRRNLFKKRELDNINWYISVASTLTIIFVYVHVMNYYEGEYLYDSIFGQSVRTFLLFPAVLATPVLLIFNFYPREVLRKLYSQSIDFEIKKLRVKLQNEALNSYEKRSYIIEFDKMSRDELRHSLRLALTDLPIGITILIMVLEPLLKR